MLLYSALGGLADLQSQMEAGTLAAADFAAQRPAFARLRILQDQITAAGLALDTLSMGMSDDLEAAIAEGATLVRVGTALFGPRR